MHGVHDMHDYYTYKNRAFIRQSLYAYNLCVK